MSSSLPTLQDARSTIAARVAVLDTEIVELRAALGRVAARPVVAVEPLPGFDNSAMDGYAVRAADTTGAPVTLPVVGEARAGHAARRALRAHEAMRISTGALLPAGADAVVRTEQADGSAERFVTLRTAVTPGHDVRRTGEEVAAGGPLIGTGTLLGAVELAALGAAGVRELSCRRPARVAIVVTGDELTPAGRPLAPGAVRDSNRLMLEALAVSRGALVVRALAAPDEPAAVTAALVAALERTDLVITCGGMSVGPHDHVRAALTAAHVELAFAGVALVPGRPAAFGVGPSGQSVLGLPGNPLSALVAFRLLGEPVLDALSGSTAAPRSLTVPAAHPLARRPRRTHVLPCRLKAGAAVPLRAVGHGPTAALGADGLALVPPGEGALAAGDPVEVALL